MSRLCVGVDLGTSGLRAVAIDEGGVARATASARIDPAARRDPAAGWRALTETVAKLAGMIDLAGVAAVAIDGTSGTILPVGADGLPLGPASLYNDRADPAHATRVDAVAPPESAARGATSPLARFLAQAPDTHLAHETDYLTARLTGLPGITDENNALKSGYDPVAGAWPEWLSSLGVTEGRLPRVVPPGTPIGHAIALFTKDALVIAGTTDGCAAFLATGADQLGDGVTSLGSTVTLKLLADRPIADSRYGVYSHRLLGQWLVGGASNAGGAVLARDFDAGRLAELSARVDPEQDSEFDYYPLVSAGERFPVSDPTLAPRLTPRPTDDVAYLHGLLDGLARIEALGYRRLTELGAPTLRAVRTTGGGARNPAWTRLRERRLGVAMRPATSEDAAYGTARLALHGLAHG